MADLVCFLSGVGLAFVLGLLIGRLSYLEEEIHSEWEDEDAG